MRLFLAVVVTGFISLGQFPAGGPGGPGGPPDPEVIEAKLRKVREQLDKLRAEESVLAEQLADAKASVPGSIKAEVSGVLRRDGKDGAYYISLRSPNGETRVWLPPTDDKRRDQFGSLHGKAVVAIGGMHQRHPARAAPYAWSEKAIPEGAFYLWPFEIAPTPAPGPKK
jgi:hypothetical protein